MTLLLIDIAKLCLDTFSIFLFLPKYSYHFHLSPIFTFPLIMLL